MHRLIGTCIGFVILHSVLLCQSASQSAVPPSLPPHVDSTTHALRPAAPDSLSLPRVDTLPRILPMRSVGSLTPASRPYPGLDADGIRWNEYRTTTDLFTGIPGVFVRDMGSPGQDNQVTIGGAEHTGTAFLVDGVGQNDPFTGTYNFAFFPVEGIERLEIVTGPRSFLYGTNAVGGAVNVVTKNFSNNRPYTHIRYSQSVDSYTQTDAMFSQNIFPRFNLSFGLAFLGYGSNRWTGDLNKGQYPNADNQAYSFRTKLRYNLSHTVNLTFTHFYDKSQTGLNGGVNVPATLALGYNVYDENSATVMNLETYEKRFNHHAALSAVYRPGGDSSLSAVVTLYGAEQRRELRDEENRISVGSSSRRLTDGVVIQDDFQTNILGARGQVDWSAGINLITVIGDVNRTRFGNSIFGPDNVQSDRQVSVKDEVTLDEHVSAAVYGTSVSNSQAGGGADVSLTMPGLASVTAGASVSHRRPRIAEYYSWGGADTLASAILKASGLVGGAGTAASWDETHHVYEASFAVTPGEHARVGITATHRLIENWNDHTSIVPVPARTFTVDCVTASVGLRHGNFFLDGEATYTRHSDVLRGSTAVRLYPEFRGQGSIYYRGLLANGNLDLKAGVKGNFFSEFDGEQFNTLDAVLVSLASVPIVSRPIGNAGTVGIFVVAHIGDAHIHILWENITNSAYMLSPFYPMYSRAVRFGVSWDFQD